MKQTTKTPDIEKKGEAWFYSDTVKEHFLHPKNLMDRDNETGYKADGIGQVGSPACGDVMKMWIKVDRKGDKITDCKWLTFGCASAIASTSMLSVMVTEKGGMKLNNALQLRPKQIIDRLGGLPAVKIHCSVLGDQALREAIKDYFKKSGQEERLKSLN